MKTTLILSVSFFSLLLSISPSRQTDGHHSNVQKNVLNRITPYFRDDTSAAESVTLKEDSPANNIIRKTNISEKLSLLTTPLLTPIEDQDILLYSQFFGKILINKNAEVFIPNRNLKLVLLKNPISYPLQNGIKQKLGIRSGLKNSKLHIQWYGINKSSVFRTIFIEVVFLSKCQIQVNYESNSKTQSKALAVAASNYQEEISSTAQQSAYLINICQ